MPLFRTNPTYPLVDVPGMYIPGTNRVSNTAWGSNFLTQVNSGGLATVGIIGDSLGQGMYASSLRDKAWTGVLRDAFISRWGDGGSGFYGTMNSSVVLTALGTPAGAITGYGTAGDLWTLSAGWAGQQGLGPGWQVVRSSTNGDTAQPPNVRGRYVDIVLRSSAGTATLTYQIDGGSVVPVTPPSGVSVTTIDTGSASNATHTVLITNTSVNALDLCGVRGRNSSGVIVDRYATYGAKTSTMNNTDSVTSGTYSGGANAPISSMKAQLFIYALSANDCNQSIASDTTMSNITQWLNGVYSSKYGGTTQGNVDTLFVLPHMGKFDATTALRGNVTARIAALCRAEGHAFIDLHTLGNGSWDWMNTQGYMGNAASLGASGTDSIHLSDTGMAWYSARIQQMLGFAGIL